MALFFFRKLSIENVKIYYIAASSICPLLIPKFLPIKRKKEHILSKASVSE